MGMNGVVIYWDNIYQILFMAGVVVIFAINFEFVRYKIRSKRREWNVPISSALNWIANNSHFGKSVRYDERYKKAVNAFWEKAKNGDIGLAGIKAGHSNQNKISPRLMKNLILNCTFASGGLYGDVNQGEIKSAELFLINGNNKTTAWNGLAVDKEELIRIWPGNSRGI